jgi:hypothetical protein
MSAMIPKCTFDGTGAEIAAPMESVAPNPAAMKARRSGFELTGTILINSLC